ncbi:beta-ketoacyl synthase N-terminal-like domain-containing protein [Bermanella sp. R86510]|uniref:beta-ketoacyl synthase N-terminal-like domain-containing protein n=1 Tax=unclassified Bermanella TaxID=2627862 RepID=UPI0037C8879D
MMVEDNSVECSPTERKRIVITGVGICSAIGENKESFTDGLFACQSAIGTSEEFNQYFNDCYAAQINHPVQYQGLTEEQISRYDRVTLWAYKVAREALQDANINDHQSLLNMASMFAVSGAATEPFMEAIHDRPVPMDMVSEIGNYGACAPIVTHLLGLGGGYEVVATACTASTNALGLGFDTIQSNKAEQVLIVGSEPLYLPTFSGFKVLDAMAQGPCSPFSGEPGMSVGEGAGALILENYDSAKARGARIYAEVLGYATSCDAYHETSPEPRGEGASMVMQQALRNANVEPSQIDYINVHGTGTAANDRAESSAVKHVFSENNQVPVSSTKSYFGHNISAAGVMEMVACLVTLPEKSVLPTLNFKQARDYVDLNVVANEFLPKDVNVFMKNNYAFGGNNCSVIASMKPASLPVSSFNKQRVVITGSGNISALGVGQEAYKQALQSGDNPSQVVTEQILDNNNNSGLHWLACNQEIRESLQRLPLDENGKLDLRLYKVADFNPRKVLRSVDTRKLHPAAIYAMVAAEQALSNAGLKINKRNRDDVGMILGLSRGPQTALDNFFSSMRPEPSNIRTSEFPKALFNSVSSSCATMKGIRGYNTTLATGYNASLGALIQGYEVVRQDMQGTMLVGGADEQALGFSLVMHAAHNDKAVNYDTDAHSFKIYDPSSNGYHMGEGAGLVVLESISKATERGANIQAEILGYGRASATNRYDVSGCTLANAMVKAIKSALVEANIEAQDVDLVCGTSCGYAQQDEAELDAISQTFGGSVPVTNINGYTGFVEASSGILSVQAVLAMMDENIIYPVANMPQNLASGIDVVTTQVRQKSIQKALVIGFNEAGNCYALLVGRPIVN